MERKEGTMDKKEEYIVQNSLFSDYMASISSLLRSIFDFHGEGDKSVPLGFMELLGVKHYMSPPLFDMAPNPIPTQPMNHTLKKIESLEVINYQPATPISSSISSALSEAINDETIIKVDNPEEDQQKTEKHEKLKKTNKKKKSEPRIAFMTKSELDHLEDGYRWRKYGQKAVKNNLYPRSYYRCTSTSCNVKKRVERCFSDPSIVVTTYQGQPNHLTPGMPRPTLLGGLLHMSSAQTTPPSDYQLYQNPFPNSLSPGNFGQFS